MQALQSDWFVCVAVTATCIHAHVYVKHYMKDAALLSPSSTSSGLVHDKVLKAAERVRYSILKLVQRVRAEWDATAKVSK
jgi:hypothetical protein